MFKNQLKMFELQLKLVITIVIVLLMTASSRIMRLDLDAQLKFVAFIR